VEESLSQTLARAVPRDELAPRAALAAMVWDSIALRRIQGGPRARLGAVVENVIAAMQGAIEPSSWPEAGAATAEAVERRCADGSAVAAVLLRLRPAVADMGSGFRAEDLGTDAVGRGAGWSRTANTVEIAKACNDCIAENDLAGGAVFRALKDITVAAVQGGVGPTGRRGAGVAIGALIRRRMRGS
jgi:hypothetical protein